MSKLSIQVRFGLHFHIPDFMEEDRLALGAWLITDEAKEYRAHADANFNKDGPVITIDENSNWFFSIRVNDIGSIRPYSMYGFDYDHFMSSNEAQITLLNAFTVFLNDPSTPPIMRKSMFWSCKKIILSVLP